MNFVENHLHRIVFLPLICLFIPEITTTAVKYVENHLQAKTVYINIYLFILKKNLIIVTRVENL